MASSGGTREKRLRNRNVLCWTVATGLALSLYNLVGSGGNMSHLERFVQLWSNSTTKVENSAIPAAHLEERILTSDEKKSKQDVERLRKLLGCSAQIGWSDCLQAVEKLLNATKKAATKNAAAPPETSQEKPVGCKEDGQREATHAPTSPPPSEPPTNPPVVPPTEPPVTQPPTVPPTKLSTTVAPVTKPPTPPPTNPPATRRPRRNRQQPNCQVSAQAKNLTVLNDVVYNSSQSLAWLHHYNNTTTNTTAIQQVDTALCFLDTANTQRYWMNHFPHAAQSIFPCWSFFQRVKEEINPRAQIGFWLNSAGISNQPFLHFRGEWVNELLLPPTRACMYFRNDGFSLDVFRNASNGTLGMLDKDNNKRALVYRPPNGIKNEWRTPEWFSRPEDALALRQVVLQTAVEQTNRPQEQDGTVLHIGLIQREKHRRITNLDDIESKLREAFPSSNTTTIIIEQVMMEQMTVWEQAAWWSRQHVVVAAHGAALMNMIFLQPRTAGLVEVFSQGFYELEYFKRLSQSMGMPKHLHRQWLNSSVTDPEWEYQESLRYDRERSRWSHRHEPSRAQRDVTPIVVEVVQLVQEVVEALQIEQKQEASSSEAE